jgi:hypothetical protein
MEILIMKKNLFYHLLFFIVLFISCRQDEVVFNADQSAIIDIIEDPNKILLTENLNKYFLIEKIDAIMLPVEARILSKSVFGYQVEMSNGHNLYFNQSGVSLNDTSNILIGRGNCLFGKAVMNGMIDKRVEEHIDKKYPGSRIISAYKKGNDLGVLLDKNIVISSTANYSTFNECNMPRINRTQINKLPPSELEKPIYVKYLDNCIKDYIIKEFRWIDVDVAFKRKNNSIYVKLESGVRLVFDDKCKVIYDSTK